MALFLVSSCTWGSPWSVAWISSAGSRIPGNRTRCAGTISLRAGPRFAVSCTVLSGADRDTAELGRFAAGSGLSVPVFVDAPRRHPAHAGLGSAAVQSRPGLRNRTQFEFSVTATAVGGNASLSGQRLRSNGIERLSRLVSRLCSRQRGTRDLSATPTTARCSVGGGVCSSGPSRAVVRPHHLRVWPAASAHRHQRRSSCPAAAVINSLFDTKSSPAVVEFPLDFDARPAP